MLNQNKLIARAIGDNKLAKAFAKAGTKSHESATAKQLLFKRAYNDLELQDAMYFVSPKTAGSLATPELWNFYVSSIALGLPKAAQEMLTLSAKNGLRQTEAAVSPYLAKTTANKKYWRQNIGGVIYDLKSKVKAYINTGNSGSSPTQLLMFNDYSSLTKRWENWEDCPDGLGIDLVEEVNRLKLVSSKLKTFFKFK